MASNAGRVGKKRDSGRIFFAAHRSTVLSTVLVANCEKQSRDGRRRASSTPRRPLFAQDDDEVFVTGSTLYAGEVKSPEHNPIGHSPTFSAAVGHRRTVPGGYICRKLTLTRTPDHIRPTRRGPDPNRSTNGSKQGGYDLSMFVGDNRKQQNII